MHRIRKAADVPNWAWQTLVAFASMLSNTGCSSPSEFDMTRKTSDVAVCCSNDLSARTLLGQQAGVFDSNDGLGRKVIQYSICVSAKGRASSAANTELHQRVRRP